MKKRYARSAAIGLVIGTSVTVGLGEVLEIDPNSVDKVHACANKIGTVAVVNAIYDHTSCYDYAHDFTYTSLGSNTNVNPAESAVSLTVSGPSKQAFLDRHLAGAESSVRLTDEMLGIAVLVLSLAGAATFGYTSKQMDIPAPPQPVAETV